LSTLVRAKFRNLNIVASARFPNRVQWLMEICDKMNQEFERLNAIRLRRVVVAESLLEYENHVHHAIVVICSRRSVLVVRTITIPPLGKATRVHGDIHKMPAKRFRPLGLDLICTG